MTGRNGGDASAALDETGGLEAARHRGCPGRHGRGGESVAGRGTPRGGGGTAFPASAGTNSQTEEAGAAGTSDAGFRGRGRLSLLPGVVKTSAPAGLTPVVYEWQNRDHLCVMGGLTPQGKMYSLVRQEALNGLHSVAFLRHL